uniref:Uncharacterized protein n=1 Tax=Glossina palpalis gambiensis TaxID=67801 RepID=A0A1B0BVR8_9MUSC
MKFELEAERGAVLGFTSCCETSWFGAAVLCAITTSLRETILRDMMMIAAALMINAEYATLDLMYLWQLATWLEFVYKSRIDGNI